MGTKHLTDHQKSEILRHTADGKPTTETARLTGASIHQVRHILKVQNIDRPGLRDYGACYRHDALLRQLVADGQSLLEIGRQIGTNARHVLAYIEKHQIPHQRFQQSGKNNPAWKGGRMLEEGKYVLIHRPDHPHSNRHGYVREHRLVMESMIGRYLEPQEVVHHDDDDTLNNDPSNLVLYASNAEHLAATLKGKRPRWTAEGMERMREAGRRTQAKRRSANLAG